MYNPHPVAVLTGIVTSERIGERCGDAPFESGGKRFAVAIDASR
jgi:hypothetical protein